MSIVRVAVIVQDVTCSGRTVTGQDCTFPFRYGGVEYNACTTADNNEMWCATQTVSPFLIVLNLTRLFIHVRVLHSTGKRLVSDRMGTL